jgi:hypothetical protein
MEQSLSMMRPVGNASIGPTSCLLASGASKNQQLHLTTFARQNPTQSARKTRQNATVARQNPTQPARKTRQNPTVQAAIRSSRRATISVWPLRERNMPQLVRTRLSLESPLSLSTTCDFSMCGWPYGAPLYLFMYLCIYSCIYSCIYLFVYLFIYYLSCERLMIGAKEPGH